MLRGLRTVMLHGFSCKPSMGRVGVLSAHRSSAQLRLMCGAARDGSLR